MVNGATIDYQRLIVNAAGGTYRLGFNGAFTAALNHNATPQQIQAALEALAAIDEATVQAVAAGPHAGSIQIAIDDPDGNQSQLTLDTTNLVGTASISTTQNGGRRAFRIGANEYDGTAGDTLTSDFDNDGSDSFEGQGDSGGPGFIDLGGGNLAIASVVSHGGFVFGDGENNTRVSLFDAFVTNAINAGPYGLVLDMQDQVAGDNNTVDSIIVRRNGANLEIAVGPLGGEQIYYRDSLANINDVRILGSADNDLIRFDNYLGVGSVDARGGTDTIASLKDANFTLTNTSLAATDGMNLTLSSVEVADLAGGASANTFDVGGWTRSGSLNGGGGSDTVSASKNANFTLTNTSLTATDGLSLTLSSIEVANLTGGAGGNSFDVSGWTQTGTISGAGGTDTIIDPKDADFTLTDTSLVTSDGMSLVLSSIEVADLTGGASANTFNVGGWTGTGSLNGAGGTDTVAATKNADFTLNSSSLVTSDGMSLNLTSIEAANLTGGTGPNTLAVQSWIGTLVNLDGGDDSDSYLLGNGDLDDIAAAIILTDAAGAADAVVINDQGNNKLSDYELDALSFVTRLTSGVPRALQGVTMLGVLETVTLNASTGANNIYATPDVATTFFINGNNPTFAGPGVDYLEVDFANTRGRKLTYSGPPLGNGKWEFLGSGNPLTGARRAINFTSIEKIKYFEILAVAADGGFGSRPIVQVYDAETKDLSVQFLAYAANWKGGVRVAVGDVTGEGIPEVVTAPAGNMDPTVNVFEVLGGTKTFSFQGAAPGFGTGLFVAVGDVTGDARPDIVTAPSFGLPLVHVFAHTGNNTAPYLNYRGVASAAGPKTPTINAFSDLFLFTAGVGGLGVGNVMRHANGVSDIVVSTGGGLTPVVRVFDYFSNGASNQAVKQLKPFGSLALFGTVSIAVANIDSASGFADIVMGAGDGGGSKVAVWHNDTGALTKFTAYSGAGSNSAVRVAVKRTGPGGTAQIFTAQGDHGQSDQVRKFAPNGALVDHILETDPAFEFGTWLG
jgi:hypothetical protein